MKLHDIITRVQVLSQVGNWEGNVIDENLMAMCLAVFHETLNDINNDPKITLVQKELDYQTYAEPWNEIASAPGRAGWIDVLPPAGEPETPSEPPDSLFPGIDSLPFAASASYPLPSDCRRVIKALSGMHELRKTDYSEIMRGRMARGSSMFFAVNGRSIELARAAPCAIVYAKEFKEFMPQDEADIPHEALSYLINMTALNVALTYQNAGAAERCKAMAEKSYNALVANLSVNMGVKYVNPLLAMNRFEIRAGGILP